MNEQDFNEALNHVDEKYIEEHLEEESKKTNRQKRPYIKRFALAACIVIAVIIGITIVRNNAAKPFTVSTIDEKDDNSEGSGKETYELDFVINTMSAFAKGEQITIDVGMGTHYSDTTNKDIPSYNNYDITGYSVFIAYETAERTIDWPGEFKISEFPAAKTDSKIIINGEQGEFKKRFEKDDLESLEIREWNKKKGRYANVDPEFFHYETLELDFSNIEVGESGKLFIVFAWHNTERNLMLITGESHYVAYYKGEYGVGLSLGSTDVAEKNYKKAECYLKRHQPAESNDSSD